MRGKVGGGRFVHRECGPELVEDDLVVGVSWEWGEVQHQVVVVDVVRAVG